MLIITNLLLLMTNDWTAKNFLFSCQIRKNVFFFIMVLHLIVAMKSLFIMVTFTSVCDMEINLKGKFRKQNMFLYVFPDV